MSDIYRDDIGYFGFKLHRLPTKKEAMDQLLAKPFDPINKAAVFEHLLGENASVPRDPIAWVSRAARKDYSPYKRTPVLHNTICIRGEWVFATDGHRIHVINNTLVFDDGVYSTEKKIPKILDTNWLLSDYPDLEKIVPNLFSVSESPWTITRARVWRGNEEGEWYRAVELLNGCWVSSRYLIEAVGRTTKIVIHNEDTISPTTPAIIKTKHGRAVIMPIKVD